MEFLIFILIGIFLGILMGLLPGIHPNLVILGIPLLIVTNLDPLNILGLIVALGITNSIVDFIPSILLGAPDSGNELSILPGHKMIMEGHGYEAVKLTVIGSLIALIISITSVPLLYLTIPFIYSQLTPYIGFILVAASTIMIVSEKRRFYGFLVFGLSGIFGLMLNQIPVNSALILFPIFSGMFGVSILILQIRNNTKIPEQNISTLDIENKDVINGSIVGSIGGMFTGLFPGLGTSQIASFLSIEKKDHKFLSSIGAITTANILLSILSLILIGKSRSGLAITIESILNITINEFAFILSVALFSGAIAVIATLLICKHMINFIQKIDYNKLSYIIIALLFSLSFFFLGYFGILLLITSTALGLFTNLISVKKSLLMGILLLPTILFYIS